jgi:hypothetical protein
MDKLHWGDEGFVPTMCTPSQGTCKGLLDCMLYHVDELEELPLHSDVSGQTPARVEIVPHDVHPRRCSTGCTVQELRRDEAREDSGGPHFPLGLLPRQHGQSAAGPYGFSR